eukprot:Pgem_evm1s837
MCASKYNNENYNAEIAGSMFLNKKKIADAGDASVQTVLNEYQIQTVKLFGCDLSPYVYQTLLTNKHSVNSNTTIQIQQQTNNTNIFANGFQIAKFERLLPKSKQTTLPQNAKDSLQGVSYRIFKNNDNQRYLNPQVTINITAGSSGYGFQCINVVNGVINDNDNNTITKEKLQIRAKISGNQGFLCHNLKVQEYVNAAGESIKKNGHPVKYVKVRGAVGEVISIAFECGGAKYFA